MGLVRQLRAGRTLIAVVLLAALAACGGSGDAAGTEGPAPVIVDVDALDGATITIGEGRMLLVRTPDLTGWVGFTADPTVAEFNAGQGDGSPVLSPGFEARGSGATDASLTAPDGTVHLFMIVVE